jgi:hypothetical protein
MPAALPHYFYDAYHKCFSACRVRFESTYSGGRCVSLADLGRTSHQRTGPSLSVTASAWVGGDALSAAHWGPVQWERALAGAASDGGGIGLGYLANATDHLSIFRGCRARPHPATLRGCHCIVGVTITRRFIFNLAANVEHHGTRTCARAGSLGVLAAFRGGEVGVATLLHAP